MVVFHPAALAVSQAVYLAGVQLSHLPFQRDYLVVRANVLSYSNTPDGNMTCSYAGTFYSSPRAQDILPHLALPILLVLSLFVPPFRLRGVLFVALIAVAEWGSTVSLWPPNVGDTRPFKYALAGSWFFVLPVVQRILVHVPERDFWRVDDEEIPGHNQPGEFTWAKAWWALALFATPRAVGWNFGSRKFNAWREAAKTQTISRTRFVVVRLGMPSSRMLRLMR